MCHQARPQFFRQLVLPSYQTPKNLLAATLVTQQQGSISSPQNPPPEHHNLTCSDLLLPGQPVLRSRAACASQGSICVSRCFPRVRKVRDLGPARREVQVPVCARGRKALLSAAPEHSPQRENGTDASKIRLTLEPWSIWTHRVGTSAGNAAQRLGAEHCPLD